jgi:hypothetical protein
MLDQIMLLVLFAFFFSFLVIMVIWSWVETGGCDRPFSTTDRTLRGQKMPCHKARATVAPTVPALPWPSRRS